MSETEYQKKCRVREYPIPTYEEWESGTSVRWPKEENTALRAEVRRLRRRQERPWYRKLWNWMRRKNE